MNKPLPMLPLVFASLSSAAILTLATLSGCETNAATGRSQYSALSPEQEVQLGKEAAPQIIQEHGGSLADPALNSFVTAIGAKMAATTEGSNPQLPWNFTILNSDILNAFALPGGEVFISRGLMQRMTNEAQLAGVIGHEIGHVTARHTNDRIWKSTLVGGIASIGSSILTEGVGPDLGQIAPQVVQMGGETVVLRFSREDELEADKLGMRYMANVGYNPTGQRQVMQILEAAAGEPNQSEWFSTHPYPKTRIEQIDQLLSTTYASQHKSEDGYFEDRFKANVLKRLTALPPAAHPFHASDYRTTLVASPRERSLFAPPQLWCAHCRDNSTFNAMSVRAFAPY